MSNKPAIPVKTALVKQFNKEHAQFMAASNKAGPLMVKTFNRARTLGILIKELMGREVITENCVAGWLRDNPGALAETHVGWLMNFVRIANKLSQGELKLFADAPQDVKQLTLQCAGLLPPDAAREGEQLRHAVAPAVEVCEQLADMRIKWRKALLEDAPRWDDQGREFVLMNLRKTREFLVELEQQLGGVQEV
jgi:hypothetical protein